MAELWYPHAERDESGLARLAFTGGPNKGVLHTTEGKNYASARAAFVKNKSWPHFTCSPQGGQFRCWQHEPLNEASRSLKNAPGGVATNTDGAIQIELVGTCNTANTSWGDLYVGAWPAFYKAGIARLMRWIEANTGIKAQAGVTFKAYPSSYGNNGVRMSGPAFDAYNGWCGHQHVPENDHGDPGLIDIAFLLNGAVQPQPPVVDHIAPTSVTNFPEDCMVRNEIPYSSNGAGDAWMQTSLPYDKVVSIVPWTAHVDDDAPKATVKACGTANFQDRGGFAYIVIKNGMPGLSGAPLVVWTAT